MTLAPTEFDPTAFLPLARSIARRFAADWPGIEEDEIFGELSLCLVEDGRALAKAENVNAATSALLRKKAAAYCGRERGRALAGTADYLYGSEEVEAVTELLFQPADQWGQNGRQGATVEGDRRARDGMDAVTSVVDARAAWDHLTEAQQHVISQGWQHGPSNAAERAGVALDTWSKRHSRALRRLRDLMNTHRHKRGQDHEGPGARRALSNADARNETGTR